MFELFFFLRCAFNFSANSGHWWMSNTKPSSGKLFNLFHYCSCCLTIAKLRQLLNAYGRQLIHITHDGVCSSSCRDAVATVSYALSKSRFFFVCLIIIIMLHIREGDVFQYASSWSSEWLESVLVIKNDFAKIETFQTFESHKNHIQLSSRHSDFHGSILSSFVCETINVFSYCRFYYIAFRVSPRRRLHFAGHHEMFASFWWCTCWLPFVHINKTAKNLYFSGLRGNGFRVKMIIIRIMLHIFFDGDIMQ